MILNANHQFCGLQSLMCAIYISSVSIFQKGWQRAGGKGKSNGSGSSRSLVNDLIGHQSIEGVEDMLHNCFNTKMNFVYQDKAGYEPDISSKGRCKAYLWFRA